MKKAFDKEGMGWYYSKAVTKRERRQEKRLKNLKKLVDKLIGLW